MNTTINQNHGAGNWIAFLFGAIFNVMAGINHDHILEQSIIALIGGVIWLGFHVLATRIKVKGFKPKSKSSTKLNHNNHAKD